MRALLLTIVFLAGWAGDVGMLPAAEVPVDWDDGYVPIALRCRAEVQERIETANTCNVPVSGDDTPSTARRGHLVEWHDLASARSISLYMLKVLRC
jgi:hypothetical protein